jgi:hypothetical protein
MVRALRKAADSLKEGGVIINVHDLVDPPRIELHRKQNDIYAGQLLDDNDFIEQQNADQAINQVIQDELLTSDRALVFEYYIRADSLNSLETWLDDSWGSAFIPEGTRDKVIELEAQLGSECEVVLRIVSRITELKYT